MLGRPGAFDASAKLAGIRGAFNISPWMFLPLVVVVMAALKFPPFTSIFADAIAGGLLNMIWFIITALAFGGVVEKAGLLEPLITPIIEKAKSAGTLVAMLASSIVATNLIAANQYIAIVLPGRTFKSAFARRGLAPALLSRSVADAATPTSSLIPWNSYGAYMAAALGVSTGSYAPWTFFGYLRPIFAAAVAYAGIRMMRLPVGATVRAE